MTRDPDTKAARRRFVALIEEALELLNTGAPAAVRHAWLVHGGQPGCPMDCGAVPIPERWDAYRRASDMRLASLAEKAIEAAKED